MRPSSIAALASSCGAANNCAAPNVIERDVAIIGGGSSGTYAAVRLMQEGYKVAILEKEAELGGHVNTYIEPETDTVVNMGVVVYHNISFVRNYFDTIGADYITVAPNFGNSDVKTYYDFNTGDTSAYTAQSQDDVNTAIAEWTEYMTTNYIDILGMGYSNLTYPVPEELLMPFGEFLESKGWTALFQHMNSLSPCNGKLHERPLIYAMRSFSPYMIDGMSHGFALPASGNNQDIYTSAQQFIGDDNIIFNSNINSVLRTDDGVVVKSGNNVVKAKKLIVAMPPMLDHLQEVGMDLSAKEADIFKKVQGTVSASLMVSHSSLNLTGREFWNIGDGVPYGQPAMPGSYSLSVATPEGKMRAWFGGVEGEYMSEEEITEHVQAEFTALQASGVVPDGQLTVDYEVSHYPYLMHVTADQVTDGFYKDFYGINGERNTFWTGAAYVENDSSIIYRWSEAYLLPKVFESLAASA